MKFTNIDLNAEISGIEKLDDQGNKTIRMVMRVHVGEVDENEYGLKSFSHSMTYEPVVEFTDGTMVILSWQNLLQLAVKIKGKYENSDYQEEEGKQTSEE